MSNVTMPRLSDSMEEGTVVRWLKADGDRVEVGDELVEIETDKATIVYNADAAGVLSILARSGATVRLGEPIAHLGEGAVPPPPDAGSTNGAPAEAGVAASPVARRLARELGVALTGLQGTGPNGRITKADIERAAADAAPVVAVPEQAPPQTATSRGQTAVHELSRTQRTIARRMAESRATVPDFVVEAEADMEAAVGLRGDLKKASGGAPSYNDMVVKASALALREHPRVNGSYRDGRFELHGRVNVGIAVAADEALLVPTVFDADVKSLGAIAAETRALAEQCRAGSITPPQLGGGTFTVSNLGMFGVTAFTAIVNQPQAAILAVGALRRRPVVRDDAIVARHTLHLRLSCDHRILYGADAARFLARVCAHLESPFGLLLEGNLA